MAAESTSSFQVQNSCGLCQSGQVSNVGSACPRVKASGSAIRPTYTSGGKVRSGPHTLKLGPMRFYAARIGAVRPDVTRIVERDGGVVELHHPDGLTRFAASKHHCTVGKGPRLANRATFLDRIPERFEKMTVVESKEPRYFATESNMPMLPAPYHGKAEELLAELLSKGRPAVVVAAPAVPKPAPAPRTRPDKKGGGGDPEADTAAKTAQHETERLERLDRAAVAALDASYTEAIGKVKRCRNPVLRKRFIATAEKIHAELVALAPVPPPAPAELLA